MHLKQVCRIIIAIIRLLDESVLKVTSPCQKIEKKYEKYLVFFRMKFDQRNFLQMISNYYVLDCAFFHPFQ